MGLCSSKLTVDPEVKCFLLSPLRELAEHGVLGACLLKTYQMGFAQNKPELPLPLLRNSLVVRVFPKSRTLGSAPFLPEVVQSHALPWTS